MIDEEEKAELRPVQASTWHGDEWLIDSGLRVGERVVVGGFHRVLPGTRVNAVEMQNERISASTPSADHVTYKMP